MPIKMAYKFTMVMLGAIGFLGTTTQISSFGPSTIGTQRVSSTLPGSSVAAGASGGIFGQGPTSASPVGVDNTMLERIRKMVDGDEQQMDINEGIDNLPSEESERQDKIPMNPKKRMYEENLGYTRQNEL
jgi:hypothetical protein